MKLIAELCQNHNGDEELIKLMIDEALEGGASHIKVQTIYSDDLTFRPEFESGLEKNGEVFCIKRPWDNEYKRLKQLELSQNAYCNFVDTCRKRGAIPLTTCFSLNRIEEIINQGFKEIKIASYDCASYTLIRSLIDKFEHIYISTGATFDEEINKTHKILSSNKTPFTFLHCVTIYPTPLNQLHLSRFNFLKKLSNEIGFSDHTSPKNNGVIASCAAIYFGATVIERHFTVLNSNQTKDGPVSITKNELKEIKSFSKLSKPDQKLWLDEKYPEWNKVVTGESNRNMSKNELLNRLYYRGRFASPRNNSDAHIFTPRYNWEEA
tara:strand:- start:387 stop:1355 length:969 start_codon:yes stop_codon:yes gene_type:complete